MTKVADPTRRKVIFRGRVQGVGFRAGVNNIASRHDVAGYVRNVNDGTVEVIVEGDEIEVDMFLAAVEDYFTGYIAAVEVEPAPADERFDGFKVRR